MSVKYINCYGTSFTQGNIENGGINIKQPYGRYPF